MSNSNQKDVKGKIKEFWDEYEENTKLLSNVTRQLAFAEGGVFWILKGTNNELSIIELLGFFALFLFFVFDVMQYYFAKRDYYKWSKSCEDMSDKNPNLKLTDIEKLPEVNENAKNFFNLKLISITIASILLFLDFSTMLVLCHR